MLLTSQLANNNYEGSLMFVNVQASIAKSALYTYG